MITGKEALIALVNGGVVEMTDSEVDMPWTEVCVKDNDFFGKVEPCMWMFINTPDHIQFRLKPRTITINGIEVPAPFKPKYGDTAYCLSSTFKGYEYTTNYTKHHAKNPYGFWRTEEEIKQVVKSLRSVFK